MKKYFVAFNWKMNPTEEKEALLLAQKLDQKTKNTEIVICPPFLYLLEIQKKIKNTKLGAQNCFWEERGAFTGEISPLMLKNIGVEYVILGHSERRRYLKEDNKMLKKKAEKVIELGMVPILCIGENKEQRAQKKTLEILKKQLLPFLKIIERENFVIAYEPVWAIGQGVFENPLEIQKIINFINELLNDYGKIKKYRVRIIYGGSVDDQNIQRIIQEGKVDGVLVGGASLDLKKALKIIKKTEDLN